MFHRPALSAIFQTALVGPYRMSSAANETNLRLIQGKRKKRLNHALFPFNVLRYSRDFHALGDLASI